MFFKPYLDFGVDLANTPILLFGNFTGVDTQSPNRERIAPVTFGGMQINFHESKITELKAALEKMNEDGRMRMYPLFSDVYINLDIVDAVVVRESRIEVGYQGKTWKSSITPRAKEIFQGYISAMQTRAPKKAPVLSLVPKPK